MAESQRCKEGDIQLRVRQEGDMETTVRRTEYLPTHPPVRDGEGGVL